MSSKKNRNLGEKVILQNINFYLQFIRKLLEFGIIDTQVVNKIVLYEIFDLIRLIQFNKISTLDEKILLKIDRISVFIQNVEDHFNFKVKGKSF